VIHTWQGGAWRSTALGLDVRLPPRVQPTAHGGWLVQAGDWFDELHVVDARGSVVRTFRIGRFAVAIQATAAGRAWVGYSEQGILGTDLGSAALAAFEPDGVGVFDLARVGELAGLPVPLNVNAVNVASEQETWAFGTGEYSLLVRIDDLSLAASWLWPNAHPDPAMHGPYGTAMAVHGQHVLLAWEGGSEVVLLDVTTRESRRLTVVVDGQPVRMRGVIGRGRRLWWLSSERIVYAVDLPVPV